MSTSLLYRLLLGFALILALSSCLGLASQSASGISKKIMPEKTVKEMRMDFKLFLTKMKLRRVPLAKERSEKFLAKLYREERLVAEQIADLNRNLLSLNDKKRQHSMKVIEVQKSSDANRASGGAGARRNLMVVSDLTQSRIDGWKSELADKERELAEILAKKDEAKNIIKNPESYISIPTNYGRTEPQEVQEREREVLLKDRLNMDYRSSVESGAENPPHWLIDRW